MKRLMIIEIRLPNTFHWDQHDGRFIVCEARLVPSAIEKRPPTSMSTMRHNSIEESKLSPRKLNAEVMVNSQAIIFFVKNDNRCELKKVEAINLNNNGEQLLDMCAPHVVSDLLIRFSNPCVLNNNNKR